MKEKTALILEGGGMRGIFTTGALDFFLEKHLTFDNCIAVSAGSCHACSFLAEQPKRAFETNVNYLDDKRYCSVYSLLTTGDLFGAEMLYDIIPNQLHPIDHEAFLQSKTVFQAVVTNCFTGQAEYPQIKDMREDVKYIRASSSLPLLSRLVIIDGVPYLDGGISDSIPIRQSFEQGNTKHVVILTRSRKYRKDPTGMKALMNLRYRKFPELRAAIETRHERYNETLDFLYDQEAKGNLFIIQPQEELSVGRIEKDKDKLYATYEIGFAEAKSRYPALLEYLD